MDQIDILVVNWNTGRLLARCLQSLVALPEAERSHIRSVVVIDNASHDDSLERARATVRDGGFSVVFIEQSTNVGFARANEIARERLRDDSAHVLLLNPDTEVRPGALGAMLAVLARDQVGIVGPRLLNPDGSVQPSVRQFPTPLVMTVLFLKLARLLPAVGFWRKYLQQDFDYAQEQAVDQVMGAAFLIHRGLTKRIGFLDTDYFIWFEEVDYCQRAIQAGWRTVFTPAGDVVHHGGASFDQLIGMRRTLPFVRSALRYARKHFGRIANVWLYALAPLALALALPASIGHRVLRTTNTTRLHD